MLPRIKIYFENGALGIQAPSADGVLGICATGVAVASTFELAKAYGLKGMTDVDALGITAANNPSLFTLLTEFYDQAGEGTKVWLMAFPDTVKLSDMADKTQDYGKKLLSAAVGEIRGLILSRTPDTGYTFVAANGVDPDVTLALTNAQALSEYAADTMFAPIFTIIEGYGYTGTAGDLTDFTAAGLNNRAAIFIGNTSGAGDNQAMGVIAGRIASIPVQRNIGRVKDGPLTIVKTYIKTTPTELADESSIHDKGYMTFRTFIGRSGYFFADDPMAVKSTDDYSHLTARRTIDKAFRICYDVLSDQLLDEIPVNANGTMQAPMVKVWQTLVENAISTQMTANGELSADATNPKDRGVVCYIDPNQNIVSTSKMNVSVRVRPFGYPRYIDVYLGFQIVNP